MKQPLDIEAMLRALGIEATKHGKEWVAHCPNADGHKRGDRNPSWRMRDSEKSSKHGSHKCFAGDTRVITREGVRTIESLAGSFAEILTMDERGYPRWVRAPFVCFGLERTVKITLSRNGVKKIVRATDNHEWFVRGPHSTWKRYETHQLIPGHRLRPASLPREKNKTVKERIGWVVESIERSDGVEEFVYCAMVPHTHCFALEDFILTSNCWPCGFGGGPVELVMHVRGFVERASAYDWISQFRSGKAEEVSSVEWQNIIPEDGFRLPPEVEFAPLPKWVSLARKYMESRRITEEQVERWGIGYATSGRLEGRIVFVSRDSSGVPRNYTARTFLKSRKRYLAAAGDEHPDLGAMFGEQHWPDTAHRWAVVALEGAINGLVVDRAYPGLPFAVIGGSNPHPAHFAKLASFPLIILLTDPDEAGNKAAQDLVESLGRHVQLIRVNLPQGQDAADVGDLYVRDAIWERVAELGQESLRSRLRSLNPSSPRVSTSSLVSRRARVQ